MRFFTLLLFLTYANLSLALGLGDIELKSNLGERLMAKVNVTDIEALPESNCFSVVDVSDSPAFKKANIVFKHSDGGNDQLTITTNEVITEPIINLRVSIHCEPNINRDYVLLLDPAPLMGIKNEANNLVDTSKSTIQVSDRKVAKHKTSSKKRVDAGTNSLGASESAEAVLDKTANKGWTQKKKATVATSSAEERLMEAYTGKPLADALVVSNKSVSQIKGTTKPKPIETHTSTDKPYLVISGGNLTANESASQPSLSLRLERQIDFSRTEITTTPLAAADTMDEVTVMTNRLAHLEKQILSLQSRNTQLMTEVEQAKNTGFSLSAPQSKWLQNLLIVLGIAATIAGGEWLRRKYVRRHSNIEQANWFEADAHVTGSGEPTISSKNNTLNKKATTFNEPIFAHSNYGQSSGQSPGAGFANRTAFIKVEKDEDENVIDHADVFIAHGRPVLATQLLQNHLADFPTESPAIWLKLLNLLAKEGTATEYDAAVIQCNQFFNIKMPGFADAATASDTSTIEDYPHITARLEGVWGSQFAVGFLNDLIYNQQSQPREGFERGTFEELFFLKQIAEILHPSNQSSLSSSLYQPKVVEPILENSTLNQALFVDIERSRDVKTSLDSNPLGAHLSTEDFFEAGMPLDTVQTLEIKDARHTAKLDQSANNTMLESGETFQANEIDFSILAGEFEDEEITLENKLTITQDAEQDIDLDQSIKLDQSKTKPETQSRTKQQASSNIIDWDMTKLDEE